MLHLWIFPLRFLLGRRIVCCCLLGNDVATGNRGVGRPYATAPAGTTLRMTLLKWLALLELLELLLPLLPLLLVLLLLVVLLLGHPLCGRQLRAHVRSWRQCHAPVLARIRSRQAPQM